MPAHSSNEYQYEYLHRKRLREKIAKLKTELDSYTGHRKELYEQISKAGLLKELEEGRHKNVEKLIVDTEQSLEKISNEFTLCKFLEQEGLSVQEINSIPTDKFLPLQVKFELSKANKIAAARKENLEKIEIFRLTSECKALELTQEAIEAKIQQENKLNINVDKFLKDKIREVVKENLWSSIIDSVTDKVTKDISKEEVKK